MPTRFSALIFIVIFIGGCTLLEVGPQKKSEEVTYQPIIRKYYVAAEEVEWDYAPMNMDLLENKPIDAPWGAQTKYQKIRYIEYTDETFETKKEQPQWLGILGPIIRAVEGDSIEVLFYNKTQHHHLSMHPHGVLYDKDNEGAMYSGITGKGSMIMPGERYTYRWLAHSKSAPSKDEGGSKVWLYHSHNKDDIYRGLMGPIIITAARNAKPDATPNDVDREFISLYFIFNESQAGQTGPEKEGHLKHAINGFIFGNLQGYEMKVKEKVRWHLLALGTEIDLHTAHWHGELVKSYGRYTDVVELLPASMKTVDMEANNIGKWMLHCHVDDHRHAGMYTTYEILP